MTVYIVSDRPQYEAGRGALWVVTDKENADALASLSDDWFVSEWVVDDLSMRDLALIGRGKKGLRLYDVYPPDDSDPGFLAFSLDPSAGPLVESFDGAYRLWARDREHAIERAERKHKRRAAQREA